MPKSNKLKEMLLHALKELKRRSDLPKDEQWFTRGEIAGQLGTASGKLNPVRVGALKELVQQLSVEERQKPNDGRDLPQYRIA